MKQTSIRINAFLNTVLTASNIIVGFLTVPIASRALSVAGYGDVGFAQSISNWLSALCILGVNTYGVRECAKVRDDPSKLAAVVKELLIIIAISTSVVLSLFSLAIVYVPRLQAISQLLWLFLIGTLFTSFGVEWFYQGIEDYAYITARGVIFKIISLILVVLFVQDPSDELTYGAILSLALSGNNLINLFRLIKTVQWGKSEPLNLRRHIRPIATFAILSISTSIYLTFDSVILGFSVAGSMQVGLYQLALKTKALMYQLVNAVLGVFIPRLSNVLSNGLAGYNSYNKLLKKAAVFTELTAMAFAGFFLVNAREICVFISGDGYGAATPSVQIMGFVNLFSCLSILIGLCVLTPLNREGKLALANFSGVPVSICLNLLLDGALGATGAALSMLIAEMVVFLIQVYYARDYLSHIFDLRELLAYALSISFALIVSAKISAYFVFGSFVSIMVATLSYAALLILILTLLQTTAYKTLIKPIVNRVRNLH